MSKPIKAVSLAVVVVLVAALVAGIAYWSVGYNPGSVAPGLYLEGDKKQKVDNPGTILTVGAHEVDFNLYRYFYLTTKYSYSYGDETYFDHDPDGSLRDTLKEATEYNMQQWFTWLDIADELNLTLNDEELAEIEDMIAEDKQTYGAQFEERLESIYVQDEDTYRAIMQQQTLITNAQEAYQDLVQEQYGDDLKQGIVSARHILVTPDGFAEREEEYEALMAGEAEAPEEPEEGEEAAEGEQADADADGEEPIANADDDATDDEGSGQEPAEEPAGEELPDDGAEDYYTARAKAFSDWLYEQILASDDPLATFEEFRAEYDEDAAGQEANNGYTFGEGTMVDSFYTGALALSDNEISEPVETNYGYHIILRLPLDEEYVEENSESLLYTQISTYVQEKYDEVMEKQTITPGTYYDAITPQSVK